MKSKQLIYQLFFLIFVILGCQNIDKSKPESTIQDVEELEISNQDGSLISVDSIDFEMYPDLFDLRTCIKDTITTSNWNIEYFVKNDSTIDKDIYIKISKNKFENIYKGESLLEFRRYFIPTYLSETEDEMILEHGCATDCSAITLISKKDTNLSEVFTHVIDFNEERKILIHITDSTYTNEAEMFQLEAINLNSDKRSNLTLRNICTDVYKASCIDTIIYKTDEIEIITLLRESMEESESTKKRNLIKI